MIRTALFCAALLAFGQAASAGELDKEATPAKVGVAAPQATGSEMDKESPTDAWHRRGGWGYYGGYRPYGFAPYRAAYWGGYPRFGYSPYVYRPYFAPSFGYRSFYSSYGYGGFGFGYSSFGYYGW